MSELKVLNEQEVLGKQFKVYGTPEEPLFLAKDVAEWLDLTNTTDMVSRVDEDEVTKLNLGGLQGECNFLTENGLYEVLMQSRKPIAKQFKKKVKEILKTIRKTGGYLNSAEKVVDTYFSDIPEEQKTVIKGILTGIEEKQKKIKTLSAENDLLSQKVLEWGDRPLINAIVRAYGHGIGDDFRMAWREFKKELLYRYSINLNARKTAHLNNGGSKKKGTLDFLNDDELPQAISTAVAICRSANIDISDILQKKAS